MDKKIPEKALEGLAPVPIHISQQTTPAGETYYKATVRHRDTIGIEKIINRIVAKRTELRASTLLNAGLFPVIRENEAWLLHPSRRENDPGTVPDIPPTNTSPGWGCIWRICRGGVCAC